MHVLIPTKTTVINLMSISYNTVVGNSHQCTTEFCEFYILGLKRFYGRLNLAKNVYDRSLCFINFQICTYVCMNALFFPMGFPIPDYIFFKHTRKITIPRKIKNKQFYSYAPPLSWFVLSIPFVSSKLLRDGPILLSLLF
jgi:hypothetical protein